MPKLAEFRQKFPQYSDISDEDLARRLHGKFYQDIPFEQFAQRIELVPPPPQPGLMERAGNVLSQVGGQLNEQFQNLLAQTPSVSGPPQQEDPFAALAPEFVPPGEEEQERPFEGMAALRAVPRGAIETTATGLKQSELKNEIARGKRLRLLARIERGDIEGIDRETPAIDLHGRQLIEAARSGDQQRLSMLVQRERANLASTTIPHYSKELEKFAKDFFPLTPEQEQALEVQVGRGVGSTATFALLRALGGRGPGAGALLTIGAAEIGSGEAIERAMRNGVKNEDQAIAGFYGAVPGLTDVVPLEILFSRIAHIPGARGAVAALMTRVAKGMAIQGTAEGVQEGVQNVMQNVIEKLTTNEAKDVLEGTAGDALVGGIVGMIFGTAGGIVPPRGTQKPTATPPTQAAPETPTQVPPAQPGGRREAPTGTPPVEPTVEAEETRQAKETIERETTRVEDLTRQEQEQERRIAEEERRISEQPVETERRGPTRRLADRLQEARDIGADEETRPVTPEQAEIFQIQDLVREGVITREYGLRRIEGIRERLRQRKSEREKPELTADQQLAQAVSTLQSQEPDTLEYQGALEEAKTALRQGVEPQEHQRKLLTDLGLLEEITVEGPARGRLQKEDLRIVKGSKKEGAPSPVEVEARVAAIDRLIREEEKTIADLRAGVSHVPEPVDLAEEIKASEVLIARLQKERDSLTGRKPPPPKLPEIGDAILAGKRIVNRITAKTIRPDAKGTLAIDEAKKGAARLRKRFQAMVKDLQQGKASDVFDELETIIPPPAFAKRFNEFRREVAKAAGREITEEEQEPAPPRRKEGRRDFLKTPRSLLEVPYQEFAQAFNDIGPGRLFASKIGDKLGIESIAGDPVYWNGVRKVAETSQTGVLPRDRWRKALARHYLRVDGTLPADILKDYPDLQKSAPAPRPPKKAAPSSLKDMKANLLAQIDAAIKEAPETQEIQRVEGRPGPRKEGVYVQFEVPGDGIFTVVNSKERLRQFRKDVDRSPGFKPEPRRKGAPGPTGDLAGTIREFIREKEFGNAYNLAELTGKPLRYGAGQEAEGKKIANPYTDSRVLTSADHKLFTQVKAFVGRDTQGTWRVVEMTTGLAMDDQNKHRNTEKDTIANTIETLERIGVDDARTSIKRATKNTQEDLEARFKRTHKIGDGGRRAPSGEGMGSSTVGMIAMEAGTHYTGLITSTEYVQDTPAPAKMIRREDVLVPFMRALKIPVYQGRIKSKFLGLYFPFREAVRLKKRSDLEVAAHEIAHLIDDRYFHGFSRRGHIAQREGANVQRPWIAGPNARAYAAELREVSYDKSKVFEGFAEYVRLWMTQEQKARELAPQFTEWWENWLSNNDPPGKAVRDAKKAMQAWFAQDPLQRLDSKMGISRSINEALDNNWDRFRQSVADNFHSFMRAELELTGRIAPAGSQEAFYEEARLLNHAYSIVSAAIENGAPAMGQDGVVRFIGKGLKKILGQVDDVAAWVRYAVAKSAQELQAQGRERLFSKDEIAAGVSMETDVFLDTFKDYIEWNTRIVDFAQHFGGLISPEFRNAWRRQWYLPFYRVGSRGGQKAKKFGIEGYWDGIKALTGGTGNLRNILDNMVENASMLIVNSFRNDVRRRMVRLAEGHRGGGRILMKIPGDTKAIKISREQIRREIYKAIGLNNAAIRDLEEGAIPDSALGDAIIEMEKAFGESPEMWRFWMFNQAPRGDNLMAVMVDGKPQYYEVFDPLIYRSIASMNPRHRHPIRSFLNKLRRFGQGTVTFTFDFMGRNLARDTIHGFVFSKHGFKPLIDSMRGLASRITKDENYKLAMANGMGMSSIFLSENALRKHIQRDLRRFMHGKGLLGKTKRLLYLPHEFIYGLQALGDAIEMSPRLGEFKRAIQQGEHPRHAAYLGSEISTDFTMGGDEQSRTSEALGWMYDSIIFLKAGVNGIDRFYRGFTKDTNKQQIMIKTALMGATSIALYLHNRGNPCYDKLEDWAKDSFWHFYVPTDLGATECSKKYLHLMLPKPWEIGGIASSMERGIAAFLDKLQKDHGNEGRRYVRHIARIMHDLFRMEYLPYAIEPLVETYALNYERFTEREIENIGMQGRLPFARYSPWTPRPFVELAERTRNWPTWAQEVVSPAKLDALFRGYFNTAGLYAIMLADETLYRSETPERRFDRYPLIRSFVSQQPRTRYEREFWNMLKEAQQLHNTIGFVYRANKPEIAAELEGSPEVDYYREVINTWEMLQNIGKEMEEVYTSTKLTRAQKRDRLTTLQQERSALMEFAVKDIEKVKAALKEQANAR